MNAGTELAMNISELMIHLLQAIICGTANIFTSTQNFYNCLLSNRKFLCIMGIRFLPKKIMCFMLLILFAIVTKILQHSLLFLQNT